MLRRLRQLGGSADLRYWVVHDLADAIHAAAAQTPLVIMLEDIHWADNGTLLALRSLAVRAGCGGVVGADRAHRGRRAGGAGDVVGAATRECHIFAIGGYDAGCGRRHGLQDAVRARADVSLLNLAAKAHGNPFLVSELVGGLGEEGRLDVSGGHAVATGDALPRRLGVGMQQRLDLLSDSASEVVRVAAVLPDRFSAGLLAAMLDRQPVSLLSALEEAVRADLLVEDGEQLRFRHDLLREATRQSLPQSLRRAMERQSASVMLGWVRPRPRSPPSWRAAPSPETWKQSMRCAKPPNRWATAMPARPRT